MLRRIGLSNFKCWKELDIELAPITLIFGANSSGKSAILQSLLMLKQTVASRDPKKYLNFGGDQRDYVDFGGYHDLVYGHKTEESVGLNLCWDLSNEAVKELAFAPSVENKTNRPRRFPSMSLRYDVSWRLDGDLFVKNLGYQFFEDSKAASKLEMIRQEEDQYQLTRYEPKTAMHPIEYDALESYPIGTLENCHMIRFAYYFRVAGEQVLTTPSLIALQLERLLYWLFHIGPQRQRAKRQYRWSGVNPSIIEPDGEQTIEHLIASSRDDGILLRNVGHRLKALDLVEEFYVLPIDQKERLYEASATVGGVESSLNDVGFGVSQVLPVITMLMSAPKGAIVLLEQPELHLHPNAQAALADLLLEVAEKRNLQLIVESHSEHIVRRMQRRIAEASPAFAKPENIKMYYCQPGEGGATIDEVDVDRFGQIANWPEKFMGDISGDIHSMSKAAFKRLHQERVGV